jgi:hypothetical protein
MATATTTAQQQPASTSQTPVNAASLAEHLGTDPRTLRGFIRSMDLGVGFGSRYTWASMKDPQVKKITAAWRKAAKGAE